MSRYMTERLFAFALSSQETLQLAQLSFRNAISAKGFLRIFQKHIILYEPIQPFIYDINKDHKSNVAPKGRDRQETFLLNGVLEITHYVTQHTPPPSM